jgi:Di-haem oxidoreductase, putative peroxidase
LSVIVPGRKISATQQASLASQLKQLHAGFTNSDGTIGRSIVLHRFGPEGEYYSLRSRLLGPDDLGSERILAPQRSIGPMAAKRREKQNQVISHGGVAFRCTQRNTPALWGAGLIDSIPAPVIEELVAQQAKQHSEISGRVARTSSGAIGRFGWRGQIDTLRSFVLAACANELGLQTTGHAQAINPLASHYRSDQNDLSEADANSLVKFVADLPKPIVLEPHTTFDEKSLQTGTRVFERIGCAQCHVRQIGAVEGIFSDLLLHDMGKALEDPIRIKLRKSDLDKNRKSFNHNRLVQSPDSGRRSFPWRW